MGPYGFYGHHPEHYLLQMYKIKTKSSVVLNATDNAYHITTTEFLSNTLPDKSYKVHCFFNKITFIV